MAKILLTFGVITFVLLRILENAPFFVDYFSHKSFFEYKKTILVFLYFGPFVLIALGLFLRLFSPEIQTNEKNGELNLSDFNFWRNANILGFGVWIFSSGMMVFLFDSGPSVPAYTILGLQQIALPIAAISVVAGMRKRDTDLRKATYFLKIPFYYAFFAIVVISILAYQDNGRFQEQKVVSVSQAVVQNDQSNETNNIITNQEKHEEKIITILKPNGGESYKIGDKVLVSWKELSTSTNEWMNIELFETKDEKPNITPDGQCLNCVGGGLRSGISIITPVTHGVGEAVWEAGRRYDGGYVKSGGRYILKATVIRPGEKNECPAKFQDCDTVLGVDWSDGVFSLTGK